MINNTIYFNSDGSIMNMLYSDDESKKHKTSFKCCRAYLEFNIMSDMERWSKAWKKGGNSIHWTAPQPLVKI